MARTENHLLLNRTKLKGLLAAPLGGSTVRLRTLYAWKVLILLLWLCQMLVESGTAEAYSGLFVDAVNRSAISSGGITVNPSDQTAFSGKVQLGTSRASFHGGFNEGGWATVSVNRAKATPIPLNLHR